MAKTLKGEEEDSKGPFSTIICIKDLVFSIRETHEGVIIDAWSIHNSVNELNNGVIDTMGIMFSDAQETEG